MVRAVGVGARCGLSVFRGPKGDWSVCLCLCLRDRPPNFLCRCPACLFLSKGTTLSNARRQVKGHALRAHEALFCPELDSLQQLDPNELQFQLEAFRQGQRRAPASRRRALAARVAMGDGKPGARGSTLFVAPRLADPWTRSSARSRKSICSLRRTLTRRSTSAISLRGGFRRMRWSTTYPT